MRYWNTSDEVSPCVENYHTSVAASLGISSATIIDNLRINNGKENQQICSFGEKSRSAVVQQNETFHLTRMTSKEAND